MARPVWAVAVDLRRRSAAATAAAAQPLPTGPPGNDCHDWPMATPFERITWPVRTERLSLRPATNADLEPTWRFRRLEAASRWLTRAPRTVLDYRRQFENWFADNEAPWRLMERIGMRRELYTVRDSLHRSGEWLDGMGYALLADEWRRTPRPTAS